MTTDIGNWAKDPNRYVSQTVGCYHQCLILRSIPFSSLIQPNNSVGRPDLEPTPAKRQRHSSELSRQYIADYPSGAPSGSSAPISFPDGHFGSSSRYPMSLHDAGKDVGSYALSHTRSSQPEAELLFGSMQLTTASEVGTRLESRRSPRPREDITAAYGLTEMMGPVQTTTDLMASTPSSLQAASAAMTSALTTQTTPASGPPQTRPFDNPPLYPDARGLHEDASDVSDRTTRRDGPAERRMSRCSSVKEQSIKVSPIPVTFREISMYHLLADRSARQYSSKTTTGYGHNSGVAHEADYIVRHRLRSQKTPPMIMGADADALGNAGITTFKPGTNTNGLLWWGERRVVWI